MPDTTLFPPALAAEFARLNARQREAVTHPDGPVLVVAGPGTGKTQLLAARVAWLLQQPDARPQEILCLTYTEAAARNLRQRLLRFAGTAGHGVAIHTFHSLGQLIIQENAELLGVSGLTAVSEVETEELLRELLDELPAGHPLRRTTGNAYYDLNNLKELFQTIKREGWTEAQLLQELEASRLSLPQDAGYLYKQANTRLGIRAGDVKQAQLAAEEDRLEKTAAAVRLLDSYEAGLARRQRFDYDDMLNWATELLRQHEQLRLRYQEQFQHFLVDEFQDTNGAQSRLLHLLADYWDNPSVMAVGDDDQSIYRFQGASLANVLDFTARYPAAKVIVLEENYRSSGAVLTAAQGLIAHNQQRLTTQVPGLSKTLTARHPHFATSAVTPILRGYATPLHEAAGIAQELTALYQAGWPVGGVGVLARTNDQLELLAQLLRAAGVPFRRKRTVNILRQEGLASSLRRVLGYVTAALQPEPAAAEPALFEVLHLRALAVPPVDLVRLAAGHLTHQRAVRAAGQPPQPWRVWAAAAVTDSAAAGLGLSEAGRMALSRALVRLDTWLQTAASQPVPVLLDEIVLGTLLPGELPNHAQPAYLLAVARTLLAWGRQEAQRQPSLTLTALLHTWDMLAKTREGLPLEQLTGPDGVGLELATVHGAKGLEWERVWLLGCQHSTWLGKRADRGFQLPSALAPAPSEASEREEARRLFFVALTRAQEHLVVSWAAADEAGKELGMCQFVQELETTGLPLEAGVVAADVLAAADHARLAPPPPPAPIPDPATLNELLADFALSATTLNAYLRCPIGCYYEQLLRVPQQQNEHLLFGNAIHSTLEQHFRQAQRHPAQEFATGEELAIDFARRWDRYRSQLPAAVLARYRQGGQDQLRAWWAHWQADAKPTAVVEYKVVRAILPDGVRLTGKLDRLDLHADGRSCAVLDYKTGSPAAAREQLRPAAGGMPATSLVEWHQDERLRGGDYWRQGVFYHILLTHDEAARYQPASVSFDYLRSVEKPGQPAQFARLPVRITPEAEATVRAQIAAVNAAIHRHDFTHGCGECSWCQLSKV